ncbi:hypothetical protein [Streptomyces chartreusis]|uniref:hypothetical protein n=1 Tax=Streptomyces chartreusis TaxID=1969 RepID=UPI0033F28AEA
MEAGEIAESAPLPGFGAATPCTDTAANLWGTTPHLQQPLKCSVTFDSVLAGHRLIGAAYRLLPGTGALSSPPWDSQAFGTFTPHCYAKFYWPCTECTSSLHLLD